MKTDRRMAGGATRAAVPDGPRVTGAMTIGVLALQGGFAEHVAALDRIPGCRAVEVRKRADFKDDFSGLVLPGGESTVIAKLLGRLGLLEPVTEAVRNGLPVFGTCAGLILLAADVDGFPAPRVGLLDVAVRRNAYGGQLDSFTLRADFDGMADVPMTFIRAPRIIAVGPGVSPLAVVDGNVVAVRQGNILAAAFHPELTEDTRIHRYFVRMAARKAGRLAA